MWWRPEAGSQSHAGGRERVIQRDVKPKVDLAIAPKRKPLEARGLEIASEPAAWQRRSSPGSGPAACPSGTAVARPTASSSATPACPVYRQPFRCCSASPCWRQPAARPSARMLPGPAGAPLPLLMYAALRRRALPCAPLTGCLQYVNHVHAACRSGTMMHFCTCTFALGGSALCPLSAPPFVCVHPASARAPARAETGQQEAALGVGAVALHDGMCQLVLQIVALPEQLSVQLRVAWAAG